MSFHLPSDVFRSGGSCNAEPPDGADLGKLCRPIMACLRPPCCLSVITVYTQFACLYIDRIHIFYVYFLCKTYTCFEFMVVLCFITQERRLKNAYSLQSRCTGSAEAGWLFNLQAPAGKTHGRASNPTTQKRGDCFVENDRHDMHTTKMPAGRSGGA